MGFPVVLPRTSQSLPKAAQKLPRLSKALRGLGFRVSGTLNPNPQSAFHSHMGVSENRGYLILGSFYNKDPAI